MREMKNTASWEGKTPFTWKKNKIKYVAPIINERSVSHEGYVGLENIESWTGRLIETTLDPTGESIAFKKDDVMFGKLRPYLGKSFVAEKDGCGSTELLVMRPAKVNSHYLGYIFRSEPLIDRIDVSTYGAKMPRANGQFIGNIEISLPDSSEQQSIVSYLDQKCAVIDEAIARRQQIIVELEEYRRALVNRVLRSETQFLTPLKYVVSYNDEKLSENENPDLSFDYIDIGSVVYKYGIQGVQRMLFRDAPSRARRIVRNDDVILSTVRTYLKASAKITGLDYLTVVSTGFITMRAREQKILPDYLGYLVQWDGLVSEVECKSYGTSYPAITAGEIVKIKVPVPSIEKQREIVSYLDEKCEQIDDVYARNIELIAKLEEYRKSIIYNAVTGKIDCREVV